MLATILIVAIVGLLLFLAIRKLVRDGKSGGCAGGCASCSRQCGSQNDTCAHNK